VNWERFDRKRSWLNFKILFQDSPGGTEENHESPQSGKPDARAENRTRDNRIRSRSITHSTRTFGDKTLERDMISH
jgi:hypothetical protein